MSDDRLKERLLEEVVIFESPGSGQTGARRLAPDHDSAAGAIRSELPKRGLFQDPNQTSPLQRQIEQFLYYQSELLDGKHWAAYIDLFAHDGVYWMPVTPQQTEWIDSASIFAEDRRLMEIRMGRVTHPNAWSQAAHWGTSHIVGNVVIESAEGEEVWVRSRFQMVELRRDNLRHLAGTYRHQLRRFGDDFRIALQRVDLLNGQAPFDYVLQVWV
jgi:3-phenylpropionate/cinnamic acid dioxygenase small subunit